MGDTTAVTPNRHSRLVLDPGAYTIFQDPVRHARRADQMAKTPTGPASLSRNVSFQPGNAWTLSTRANHLRVSDTSAYVTAASVLMAGGWRQVNTYRQASDLLGLGTDPGMIASGSPAFTKDISATTDVSSQVLMSDQAAFPQPVLGSADVPVDRVIVGLRDFPENAGFSLQFSVPGDFNTPDALMTFYFGGRTDTATSGAVAGQFALTILGNGSAELYEWTGNAWGFRHRFPWMAGTHVGNLQIYTIRIFPYGQDSIVFRTLDADTVVESGGFTLLGMLVTIAGLSTAAMDAKRGMSYYRSVQSQTGYQPGAFVTGRGNFRLDVRRDLRSLIQIAQILPQPTGVLIDAPFSVGAPPPGFTPMVVQPIVYTPKNSSITPIICDATSGTALAGNGFGTFYSNAGQANYFVRFEFAADHVVAGGGSIGGGSPPGNAEQTPVLFGYSVQVTGTIIQRPGTSLTGGLIRDVSITGPDLSPDHETAQLTINDPADELAAQFRGHGRVHSQVQVKDDAGHLTSIIFEGETAKVVALKRGRKNAGGYTPSKVFPVSEWRRYDASFVGMWARIADYVNLGFANWSADKDSPAMPPEFPQPGSLPWKVTDCLRDLLRACGFPDVQIDIPDINIRLGNFKTGASEFILMPQAYVPGLILKLCQGYLGAALVWDPNAGGLGGSTPGGMWRLLANPQPPYTNIVANFVGLPDKPGTGQLVTHPNSYNTASTFIVRGSERTWVDPPEGNWVTVSTVGQVLSADAGPNQLRADIVNYASADFPPGMPGWGPGDRTSPDWLGRIVHILEVFPAVTASNPQRAAADLQFAARRIYDVACHARKWLAFQAPLLLISDSTDGLQRRPRPLRLNDLVTVRGAVCQIRSCNPVYKNDKLQLAEYQMLQLN